MSLTKLQPRKSAFTALAFALVAAGIAAGTARTSKLLSVRFDPRPVSIVDTGDFHFLPGQLAPVHTHAAPAIGYVSKGSIYYQVEGRQPVILKAGDAFYEPVGPRILHFDNLSKTEEAVFTDFNLQQEGEPFIVFSKPLTEKIDRRSFPTAHLGGEMISSVEAVSETLRPGESRSNEGGQSTLYFVATGDVTVQSEATTNTYHTGNTFAIGRRETSAKVINKSTKSDAKLIAFNLSNTPNSR